MNELLLRAVDDRVDDLVALTADLIRFPTVNPPGEAYRPCAKIL
ncbi:MAG: succinyl-diaminopimelate desuccinylase, partial [Mesorhizobium sp.]